MVEEWLFLIVMIAIENVTVTKQAKKLFEHFSLHIDDGEHWVIQGKNGAGKTTLLQLIAGQLHPVRGTVHYDFIDSTLDWDLQYEVRQQNIHYVPTHALEHVLGNHPDFFYQQRYYTMGDVALPLVKDFFGDAMSGIEKLKLPDTFKITDLLALELTRLSNGQLKKVLIIKHLLKEVPKLLLLDYPFEGLDKDSRQDLSDFIDHLATTLNIQIILTDQYHALPTIINRRLVLENFKVSRVEPVIHRTDIKRPLLKHAESTDTGPVVAMKNLTIRYGDTKIIEDLNWQVNKGERWALTGKNGSGKTTLFSLIYADHPMAYSQQVYLFGKRRGSGESIWDIKKRISYLGPEQIHFLNTKAISDSGRAYLLTENDNDATQLQTLITFFEAGDFIDRPVRHYSSGERQLLLLLQFFMRDKELLLLDEPFQFLDIERKDKVSRYLSHHLDKDITMILITHYEEDIKNWTRQRLDLSAGRS